MNVFFFVLVLQVASTFYAPHQHEEHEEHELPDLPDIRDMFKDTYNRSYNRSINWLNDTRRGFISTIECGISSQYQSIVSIFSSTPYEVLHYHLDKLAEQYLCAQDILSRELLVKPEIINKLVKNENYKEVTELTPEQLVREKVTELLRLDMLANKATMKKIGIVCLDDWFKKFKMICLPWFMYKLFTYVTTEQSAVQKVSYNDVGQYRNLRDEIDIVKRDILAYTIQEKATPNVVDKLKFSAKLRTLFNSKHIFQLANFAIYSALRHNLRTLFNHVFPESHEDSNFYIYRKNYAHKIDTVRIYQHVVDKIDYFVPDWFRLDKLNDGEYESQSYYYDHTMKIYDVMSRRIIRYVFNNYTRDEHDPYAPYFETLF